MALDALRAAGSRVRTAVGAAPGELRRARDCLLRDLRTDPYLRYVLLLATLLAAFWFWHRIPNFATRDERDRILDPLVAYGRVIDDPSLASLREGVIWSRASFGATFYLFGIVLLPVVILAILVGDGGALASLGLPEREFGYYPAWQALPEWIWTASIALVRLANVAFAVGAVYLTYRLGTAVHDRLTGNLAALLLSLSFGFLTLAHEGGEDIPALFFVLLTLYLAYRYVETGNTSRFLQASVAGGVAIAFKLTAVPVVPAIAVAFLLRARRTDGTWKERLYRPKLLVGGAATGAVVIALGFPTLLVGGVGEFGYRLFASPAARASHATGPDAPVWWWFLRGYLSGLSLPLFLAGVAGVLATAVALARRRLPVDGTVLVAGTLAIYVGIFAFWHDFRVHHLVPTFPLIALLLADRLETLRGARPRIGGAVIALLVVTSGTYAVAGDLGYTSMPRDQAVDWLESEAPADATVEVYRRDFQDTAVPFDMRVNHVSGPEQPGERVTACPEYIQLGYRDMLYLAEGTYFRDDPAKARYFEALLAEEYNYEIAATFGPRPRGEGFVPHRPTPGDAGDLLRLGLVPHTDQYADEQELAPNQFTIILERTGPCTGERQSPF